MARTWAGGKGGQCQRPKGEESDLCLGHGQSDKYKVHGRVDGPIPAAKLAQFVAESRKPEKPELTEEEKAARTEKRKAKEGCGIADSTEERTPKRAKKDPNAPKRPTGGAYGCFLAANRKAFEKECPGAAITGVAKLASTKWKEASEADTKKYQKQYEEKKAAYDEAMKSYVPIVTAEGGQKKRFKGAAEKSVEESEEASEEKIQRRSIEKSMATMRRPASLVAVVKNAVKKKPATR